ncbi:MAG TPA: lysophospholipid acyltransferase family protein [Rhizomicrobium sp.]|jgi:1-acyl-sn-glycerol-3-phosphate acyltransferase|nr:lysophospholipid acyltransferase family protein [Rhizomicrobium sp.]
MIVLRSFAFMAWFLLLTIVLAVLFLPALALPRGVTAWMARYWARGTFWGLRVFCGIAWRIVGSPPCGPVLIASKHMSMWDTLALYLALDQPGIVLKRELLLIPFYGWYLWKAAAIPIDREGGAKALRRMTHAAQTVIAEGRPILIFPEGTRKKPGAPPDYKAGVAGLYALLGLPCVPAALDSGAYWTGFLKRPGTITLEFLEPIAPGLKRAAFMAVLQQRIEGATDRLLAASAR